MLELRGFCNFGATRFDIPTLYRLYGITFRIGTKVIRHSVYFTLPSVNFSLLVTEKKK